MRLIEVTAGKPMLITMMDKAGDRLRADGWFWNPFRGSDIQIKGKVLKVTHDQLLDIKGTLESGVITVKVKQDEDLVAPMGEPPPPKHVNAYLKIDELDTRYTIRNKDGHPTLMRR